jgi:hypothetical protein
VRPSLLRLSQHPVAPRLHRQQQGRAWRRVFEKGAGGRIVARRQGHAGHRVGRAEARGVLQHAAVEQHGDGVVVQRVGLAAQAHRLQRDAAAACEGVQHARGAPAERRANQGARPLQKRGRTAVRYRLPRGKLLDQFQVFVACGGVVGQQGCQDRRPRRRQRLARPPDVQRADVPVADVLLAHRFCRDLLQREGGLDERACLLHRLRPCCVHSV